MNVSRPGGDEIFHWAERLGPIEVVLNMPSVVEASLSPGLRVTATIPHVYLQMTFPVAPGSNDRKKFAVLDG